MRVLAYESPRLYVGGYFTTVGIATVPYLAALNAADGQVQAWVPQPDGAVFSILVGSSGSVYAGGSFSNVGGAAHARLAALDPVSGGAAAIFTQTITTGYVGTIIESGSLLYIGGTTIEINGSSRGGGVAAFVASTGAFTDWNPIAPLGSAAPTTLVPAGGNIYLGGQFTQAGGQPRTNLAAVDPSSGVARDWQPIPNGTITRMVAYGSTIFVLGNFTEIDGVARNGFAAINDSNLGPPLEPVDPGASAPTLQAKGKRKIRTTKAKVVLRGTATNAALVEYKAGKGGYKIAKGTTSKWKIPLKLAFAKTVVKVRAEGPGGRSPILKFVVRREEK